MRNACFRSARLTGGPARWRGGLRGGVRDFWGGFGAVVGWVWDGGRWTVGTLCDMCAPVLIVRNGVAAPGVGDVENACPAACVLHVPGVLAVLVGGVRDLFSCWAG